MIKHHIVAKCHCQLINHDRMICELQLNKAGENYDRGLTVPCGKNQNTGHGEQTRPIEKIPGSLGIEFARLVRMGGGRRERIHPK